MRSTVTSVTALQGGSDDDALFLKKDNFQNETVALDQFRGNNMHKMDVEIMADTGTVCSKVVGAYALITNNVSNAPFVQRKC